MRLTRKLLKKQGCAPKLAVTDKLRSYAAAFRALGLTCEQRLGNLRARAGVKEARICQIAIALLVRNRKFESTPLQQRVGRTFGS